MHMPNAAPEQDAAACMLNPVCIFIGVRQHPQQAVQVPIVHQEELWLARSFCRCTVLQALAFQQRLCSNRKATTKETRHCALVARLMTQHGCGELCKNNACTVLYVQLQPTLCAQGDVLDV